MECERVLPVWIQVNASAVMPVSKHLNTLLRKRHIGVPEHNRFNLSPLPRPSGSPSKSETVFNQSAKKKVMGRWKLSYLDKTMSFGKRLKILATLLYTNDCKQDWNLVCDGIWIRNQSIPAFWNNSPTETCVYVHFGLYISFDCTFILEIDAHFEYICILFYFILFCFILFYIHSTNHSYRVTIILLFSFLSFIFAVVNIWNGSKSSAKLS